MNSQDFPLQKFDNFSPHVESCLKKCFNLIVIDGYNDETFTKYFQQRKSFEYFSLYIHLSKDTNPIETIMLDIVHHYSDDVNVRQIKDKLFAYGGTRISDDGLLNDVLFEILKYISREVIVLIHLLNTDCLTKIGEISLDRLHGITHDLRDRLCWVIITDNDNAYQTFQKYSLYSKFNIIKKPSMENVINPDNMPVYISYSWDSTVKNIADTVCEALHSSSIPCKRDKEDCKYRDNIKDFEKEIGDGDLIVAVITLPYLHSIQCMYEMALIINNGHIQERLYPIVKLGDMKREAQEFEKLREYWNGEYNHRKALSDQPGVQRPILEEIGYIDFILNKLSEFWEYLCKVNTSKIEDLMANNCKMLIDEINRTKIKMTQSINSNFPQEQLTKSQTQVTQNGKNSVYIEHNNGPITFN
jgi:hypothetical protein